MNILDFFKLNSEFNKSNLSSHNMESILRKRRNDELIDLTDENIEKINVVVNVFAGKIIISF